MRRCLLRGLGQHRWRAFASHTSEAEKLRQLLGRWSDAYYNSGEALASDEEYDRLRGQLEQLEERPVAEVGAAPAPGAVRFAHRVPMLSLQSTRELAELSAFREATQRALETEELQWVTEIKYDGMALALHYDSGGQLRHVVTRGDGAEGEELPLARLEQLLGAVPRRVDNRVLQEPCEVRGEALLERSRFEPLRAALGYRSARNAVAGILRNERPPPELTLGFVAYGVESDKTRHADYTVRIELLKELGFGTCPQLRVHRRWEDVEAEVRRWLSPERRRAELPFEADGIVIKLDSRRLGDALGSTRHHPRHSMAFKWSERRLPRTRLEAIEWAADQSGHLRPVARVRPVQWGDGSTLTRASLHNWAFVSRHRLAPGAEVEMERSGGTVPRLVPLPVTADAPEAERPQHCPCPLRALVEDAPPLNLRCSRGVSCPERLAYRAYAVAATLGVKGLGLASAAHMAHAGLLDERDPWAVLRLTAAQLEALGAGWGPKKAANVAEALAAAARQASFGEVLATLGVAGVGPAVWSTVAAAYPSLRLLAAASAEQLATLPEVGAQSAELIRARVNEDTVAHVEGQWQRAGLPVAASIASSSSATASSSLPLRGATVVLTGTLSVPRAQLAARVRGAGGSVVAAVSGKCTVLVAGREPTQAKLDKAARLAVPVETEEQFRKRFD